MPRPFALHPGRPRCDRARARLSRACSWRARGASVHRTGMGARRSRAAAATLMSEPGDALLVLGFCGGLDERARPGDVVVATEVWATTDDRDDGERIRCDGAGELAAAVAGQ